MKTVASCICMLGLAIGLSGQTSVTPVTSETQQRKIPDPAVSTPRFAFSAPYAEVTPDGKQMSITGGVEIVSLDRDDRRRGGHPVRRSRRAHRHPASRERSRPRDHQVGQSSRHVAMVWMLRDSRDYLVAPRRRRRAKTI